MNKNLDVSFDRSEVKPALPITEPGRLYRYPVLLLTDPKYAELRQLSKSWWVRAGSLLEFFKETHTDGLVEAFKDIPADEFYLVVRVALGTGVDCIFMFPTPESGRKPRLTYWSEEEPLMFFPGEEQ